MNTENVYENIYVRALRECNVSIQFKNDDFDDWDILEEMLDLILNPGSMYWQECVREALESQKVEYRKTADRLHEQISRDPLVKTDWRKYYRQRLLYYATPALIALELNVPLLLTGQFAALTTIRIGAVLIIDVFALIWIVIYRSVAKRDVKRAQTAAIEKVTKTDLEYIKACQKCELYEKAIEVLDKYVPHLKAENAPE